MKTHADKNKFSCTHEGCTRGFPSQGRLNSHLKTHDPANAVSCKHCGRVFNAKKNLLPHEKTCKHQPGGRAAAVRDKPWKRFKIPCGQRSQIEVGQKVSSRQCLQFIQKGLGLHCQCYLNSRWPDLIGS